MRLFAILIVSLCQYFSGVESFSIIRAQVTKATDAINHFPSKSPKSHLTESATVELENVENQRMRFPAAMAALLPIMTSQAAFALDALDDVEVAELPPPYVPILFAIGILGGVGALTASLGDVYTEGEWCSAFIEIKIECVRIIDLNSQTKIRGFTWSNVGSESKERKGTQQIILLQEIKKLPGYEIAGQNQSERAYFSSFKQEVVTNRIKLIKRISK